MADIPKISPNAVRMRMALCQNPESSFPDNPKPGNKRPFHDGSAISQAHRAQDPTLENRDGLFVSYNSGCRVPSVPLEDGDVRRCTTEEDDSGFHVEKRSRTSDWPLRSTTADTEAPSVPRVALRDRYDSLNVASPPCQTSVKLRPSKFVEGSMSDRASQQPHPSYISDYEQPRDQFEAEENLSGNTETKAPFSGLTHRTNRSVTLSVSNDKSEASRPSSIFRFGKSVAAAFNPSSWKIWSKQQEEDTPEKSIPKERHGKAEKIYKELKRTGGLRGSVCETRIITQDKSISLSKHDSGVDVEHHNFKIDSAHRIGSNTVEARTEEKRYGRIFLDSPSIGAFQRGESPTSDLSLPLKDSSQYREPPLTTGETSNGPQALRRLPSRKDLQKQQKLVKRVSDLEGKLEAARCQLAEALGEPVPTQATRASRSRFTPGALASLPSERLLSAYAAPESDLGNADAAIGFGRAISIDDRMSSLIPNDHVDKPQATDLANNTPERSDNLPVDQVMRGTNTAEERYDVQKVDLQIAEVHQVELVIGGAYQEILDNQTPARQKEEKRKGLGVALADDEENCRPVLIPDNDDSSDARKPPVPKRGPGRPRKLQKVDPEAKSLSSEPSEAKHVASRAIREANNSPFSSHAKRIRSPRDRRAILSKEVASSTSNSRIARKSRYSSPPPHPESSSGKITEPDEEGEEGTISIKPSANVPPIPEITRASGTGKTGTVRNRMKALNEETNVYDDGWSQNRSQIANTDAKKSMAKSKQAFEWPADVF